MRGLVAFMIIVFVIVAVILAMIGRFIFRIWHNVKQTSEWLNGKADQETFDSSDYENYTRRKNWRPVGEGTARTGSANAGNGGYNTGSSSASGSSDGSGSANYGSGSETGYNSGGSSSYSRESSEETYYQQETQGTVIYDTRDPRSVSRRIFADDEGEYVQFEEVE